MNTEQLEKMIDVQTELGSNVIWFHAEGTDCSVLSTVVVNGNVYENTFLEDEMDLFYEADASYRAARGW